MLKKILFVALILWLCLAFRPSVEAPRTSEDLGRLLFSDPILSGNQLLSCASCHRPEFAFADTVALSMGADGQLGTRNTPGITNMLGRSAFFWDGRAATLEMQVLQPIANPTEMNLPIAEALVRLRASSRYSDYFEAIYGHAADSLTLSDALASFVRTLDTGNSAFDRYMKGNRSAMSASAIRGRQVFLKKGKCFDCHFSPDFTGDEYRNIGLFDGTTLTDPGRFGVTRDSADLGKFKVPGLRNVALTAPYMHNGMFATLRQVIDYYDLPDSFGIASVGRDTLLAGPLGLSEVEKQDLEAFLEALTDRRFEGTR
jgi:cytochrome c peroxidase